MYIACSKEIELFPKRMVDAIRVTSSIYGPLPSKRVPKRPRILSHRCSELFEMSVAHVCYTCIFYERRYDSEPEKKVKPWATLWPKSKIDNRTSYCTDEVAESWGNILDFMQEFHGVAPNVLRQDVSQSSSNKCPIENFPSPTFKTCPRPREPWYL
ncbi:hypothetical protein BU24DRAFT_425829 [Aaosphaeria arxii CBS 175.79]|uniref:Uncharacterized protein n=1 Tax=Aaosphaeria arxii CBS 175.79 TaxID=1450172 RepID=A0A6A5XGP1_9PLEO|nr:uncharacterized protein BU24DRAFT_425829 [Aaosphaeria arxii CBS 175.79]KAF2012007.1 hypothetical protein BU24DRAFT_425829 [Aaosphaeria arxii CBS 175.79]